MQHYDKTHRKARAPTTPPATFQGLGFFRLYRRQLYTLFNAKNRARIGFSNKKHSMEVALRC